MIKKCFINGCDGDCVSGVNNVYSCEQHENELYNKHFDWFGLEQNLKAFDYTYNMSDDFGVWKFWDRKETELREKIKIAKELDLNKTKTLIKKYKQKFGIRF